ncbi:MAG: cytidine deaminase [Candidatus Kerfeldbacteria bacterium]|nr:cytidine deaminase [Candidatus Kerfeldbacteria bacterium]
MLSQVKLGQYRQLIDIARSAAPFAYRPYSDYPVGAAVLTFDGRFYPGCNVENAALSQTVHAEEVAVCTAIADGALERALGRDLTKDGFIEALAIFQVKNPTDPWPCLQCRQFLTDFGLGIRIVGFAGPDRKRIIYKTLATLAPHSFGTKKVLGNGKRVVAPHGMAR